MMDRSCPTRRWRKSRLALLAAGAMMAGVIFGTAHVAAETAGKAKSNLAEEPAGTASHAASVEDLASVPSGRLSDVSKSSFQGRRDPFRLPQPPPPNLRRDIAAEKARLSALVLPPGPRGLVIAQLRLEGIVSEKATHQMIAVVTNSTNRAYFLRENEELYDGVVSRITPSAIYFKERARNSYGEATEIVKTLNPASGELR